MPVTRRPRSWLAVAFALAAFGCVRLMDTGIFVCEDNADCGELVCFENVCRDACSDDPDCGDGELCIENTCVPANCKFGKTSGCSPYACDLESNACLTACTDAGHCQQGFRCSSVHSCVPYVQDGFSCTYGAECAS